MKWYSVDENFLNYLRSYEKRIPLIDYGKNKFKPFFGSLFEIGNLIYLTQVSHPKERHYKLKENLDFVKLYDNSKLIAVVNLNYMFPVPKNKLTLVKYSDIDNFRLFNNDAQKQNYIALLEKELRQIIHKRIDIKAQKLYKIKYEYPESKISRRCFEFKIIEQKCIEFAINDIKKDNKIKKRTIHKTKTNDFNIE